MSGNYWDQVRDARDRNELSPSFNVVYDGLYAFGKGVGQAVDTGIRVVEQVSPDAAAAARAARSYAEDELPIFQDNRNKKN